MLERKRTRLILRNRVLQISRLPSVPWSCWFGVRKGICWNKRRLRQSSSHWGDQRRNQPGKSINYHLLTFLQPADFPELHQGRPWIPEKIRVNARWDMGERPIRLHKCIEIHHFLYNTFFASRLSKGIALFPPLKTVRTLDLRSSGRGFDFRSDRYQAT